MTKAQLRVLAVGPQVSLQDRGRPGFMRFGVPQSGPMDRLSHALAVAAVGARQMPVAIEVSRGGLCLECVEGSVSVGLAGGGFQVRKGEQRGGSWQVLTLALGERLEIRPGPWGNWCYLAFLGQLQAADWLGSQATHALSDLGGGALRQGQILTIDQAATVPERRLICPVLARPRQTLRAVVGPQERYFPPGTLETLFGQSFLTTDASDRMGLRLKGPAIPPLNALQIPSGPILRGALQVSGDGVATILMADHQTTGGYPRLATLLDSDLDALAQNRPQTALRFEQVSPEQAIALTRRHQRQIQALLARPR